ncbi:metallopeptidase family protein [Chloroflexota bacterium]
MVRKDKLPHRRFECLVKRALATIPEEFHGFLENVVIEIEDEPPDDIPDTIGLYEGVPLVERSLDGTILPDRITLFKGPIERSCHTNAEIETEVCLTVLHEIGHFFGLEEAQLEQMKLK